MTGFSFPFKIRLKAYIETNTAVQVLAPLDKQFVNSFMKEFNKIMIPIREHIITEVEGIEQIERHIEQSEQTDIAKKVKEAKSW
jgi:hypothetical protein